MVRDFGAEIRDVIMVISPLAKESQPVDRDPQ